MSPIINNGLKHKKLWRNQEKLIKLFSPDICIGVDEVGRGSLAGPVLAAAIAFLDSKMIEVCDSKEILEERRQEIFFDILRQKPFLGIGVISQAIIDRVNILNATKLAMKKALSLCFTAIDRETNSTNPLVLIDGNFILKDFTC